MTHARLRAALALLLALLALPAAATQDGWPALHDVARVAADDVLNLRAGPGASYAIVGALAPNARGIEVIRPSGDLRWGLVNTREGAAWASLAFLDRRPGQYEGALPAFARCFGTEPFWSLEQGPDGAFTLSDIARDDMTFARRTDVLGADGRLDRYAILARGEGTGPGLTLVLRRAACSDGMSDRAYGLEVDLLRGGPAPSLLTGCCSLEAGQR